MPDNDGDLCKARELQYLVGRPRSEIPVPVEVVNRRVVCTTCPVTMDFSPYRLNIFYNAETQIVEQVRCG
ncbi:I78 family peptidase inhibitor [Brevundimonas sp. R86498]|uniref:I78 family peptidase inhibitor n=1 Tax=Brevundimonas sp. R86498 TaxID=3093845 RepID=UPI0037C9A734